MSQVLRRYPFSFLLWVAVLVTVLTLRWWAG